MKKNKIKIEKLSFEEALAMLEKVIEKMEKEELPLEESLENFQEGMALNQHCRKLLLEAEFKVEKLLQNGTLDDCTDHIED